MSERLAFVAGEDDAGRRLDARLAEEPAVGSRAKAQRLIDAGLVSVDGEPRRKRHRLAPGEAVEVLLEEPPPVDARVGEGVDFEVVYEDDWLLVVDKPAGVVVHPAPGHPAGTLAQALAARGAAGGHPLRPGIVHRLDRDTSGLLVVAKSEEVHRALQEMLRRREIRREYLALVAGRPDARSGTIDAAVGRDRRERKLISIRTDAGRRAVTHFELVEALPRTSLLRVRLETGRTHQIRVHMAAIGHPVCGDRQYGGAACGRRLGLARQFLHSAALTFDHPVRGESLRCESKLPADLSRALAAARREPASEGPVGG
ncbi:MAG: RluA family pseudouridine synthase [Thermoleophilaceae bacterium]|nr:RluA family pseudouridine synthase [Thermoleophilaceae bacterium]